MKRRASVSANALLAVQPTAATPRVASNRLLLSYRPEHVLIGLDHGALGKILLHSVCSEPKAEQSDDVYAGAHRCSDTTQSLLFG